jgi:hypothetical protein
MARTALLLCFRSSFASRRPVFRMNTNSYLQQPRLDHRLCRQEIRAHIARHGQAVHLGPPRLLPRTSRYRRPTVHPMDRPEIPRLCVYVCGSHYQGQGPVARRCRQGGYRAGRRSFEGVRRRCRCEFDDSQRSAADPLQFTYNQDDYWNLLRDTALAKREAYLAHWAHLGGGVGQSEWEFKQPLPVSPTSSQELVSPTATSQLTASTAVNTPARSESLSSEATIHDNHGLDLHSVEKAIGGMVIAEDVPSPRREVAA